MGNMTALIVVCSVCGLLILILLFAYKKISKKNSSSKLEEEINKYKRMNEGTYVEGQSKAAVKNKKQLKKEKKQQKVASKTQKLQQKVTNSVSIDCLEDTEEVRENVEERVEEISPKEELGERYNPFEEEKKTFATKKRHDDDFDDFLNEYSYSRAAVNKNLLKQLNNLPPKVKALVLGNIFNKFDD